MFEDCYVRIGHGSLAGCVPLSPSLLASLYALPAIDEPELGKAMEAFGTTAPWAASHSVAPERTVAAVAAMLRQLMLATTALDPTGIKTEALPPGGRARVHLEALRDLWTSQPVMPADIATLGQFLATTADDALQPIAVIWERNRIDLCPLERTVLERLEQHHGVLSSDDPDMARLAYRPLEAAAQANSLAGHVQRQLLTTSAASVLPDDSLSVLSVRDTLTECEAAAAMMQRWLAEDSDLQTSEIAVVLPAAGGHAVHLGEVLGVAGLPATKLPLVPAIRTIGLEAVLHFLQCRRRPAPAMALASLYCSPMMCWDTTTGNALARATMEGDFAPELTNQLTGKAATLYTLIRKDYPATGRALREDLVRFAQLMTDAEALRGDVGQAKIQIGRLLASIDAGMADAEIDWEMLLRIAGDFAENSIERGPHHLGGITILMANEAPQRRFRKLIVMGFNDGHYPVLPASNPFFLDSEIAAINAATGLGLPSQADRVQAALDLFRRQLCAASEQVVILLSERDGLGEPLTPSATLPLLARLVDGCNEPETLIVPLSRAEGTIWDRLITWQSPLEFKSATAPPIPDHFELGLDLLSLRRKADGTPRAQSPSRLEKLLVSPLAWLLSELGASHLSWQPERLDVLLRGSLAHEVFERLFTPRAPLPDDMAIAERVPQLLADRIRAIAPFLQSNNWAVERAALEAEILKAAKHWAQLLASMGAEVVGNEFWLQGSLYEQPVHGKADCLIVLPSGQPIVIDYKKSSSGGRRERLTKGWDLQVELYRRMSVRVNEKSEPGVTDVAQTLAAWNKPAAVAYHTLNDGNLLTSGADGFDHAEAEQIEGEIARNALALLEARFAALRSGRLETNTAGDEAYFTRKASLGAYAFEDSPLIRAFMRDEQDPSVTIGVEDED